MSGFDKTYAKQLIEIYENSNSFFPEKPKLRDCQEGGGDPDEECPRNGYIHGLVFALRGALERIEELENFIKEESMEKRT